MKYNTSVIDRPSLITYVQRCLGIKSHDIELSADEYSDIVDDSMQEFLEFAFDGHEQKYMLLPTQANIKDYVLPEDVIAVVEVYGGSTVNPVTLSAFYNRMSDDLYNGGTGGYTYLDYQISMMFINDNIDSLSTPIMYNYNGTTKNLKIYDNPFERTLMLKVITYAGEAETFDNLYNHIWIKQRCVALAYERWYQQLIKYKGSLFDGGIEIDKEAIGTLAEKKMQQTDKDLLDKYGNLIGMSYR